VSKQVYQFPAQTLMIGNMVEASDARLYAGALLHPSAATAYYSIEPSGAGLLQYTLPAQLGPGSRTTAAPGELFDLIAAAPQGKVIWYFARLSESGKLTILHQFSGSDGFPNGSAEIAYGPDGNFYSIGNQQQFGISPGFIYRFTPTGAYSQLLSFPHFPGGAAAEALIAGSDGNLYGSFSNAGTNRTGEIYQATLTGQLQTVADFPAIGMSQPRSLMQAADGNIYGSTNFNQIFRYNLATHALSLLYQMAADGSQAKCQCELLEGMDGKIYGVAANGGPSGLGVVFSLDIGLPPPQPAVSGLYPATGPVGQKVLLWGSYLLGATSVSFNGVAATSVSVTSVQSVIATVPAGATTGPVNITTANGSITTTQNFTVQ
jgi:hypothetical protein